MKHYFTFFLFVSVLIFYTSCNKGIFIEGTYSDKCYVLYEDVVNDTVIFSKWSPKWQEPEGALSYVMPYGGGIVPYESQPPYTDRKKIKTEIIIDSNIDASLDSNTLNFVDTILNRLYLGIELTEITIDTANLDDVSTTETLNSENILDTLKLASFDPEKDLHVYLFSHSEFFNTSNAFAFQSGKDRIILGNKDLFSSSLLFVHELGHAFGLGHNNSQDPEFGFYNIMHESFIGCAIFLDPQQSLLMSNEDYISFNPETSNKLPFEKRPDKLCNESYYQTKMDKYINSKDRSIDGEALVGMYDSITPQLIKEVKSGEIDLKTKLTFIENFEEISESLFDDQAMRDSFVNQCIDGLTMLRKNNLVRLIGHNIIRRKRIDESEFNWDDLFTNPDSLNTHLDNYPTDIKEHPLMSKDICDKEISIREISIAQLENTIKEMQENIDSLTKYKEQYFACKTERDTLIEYPEKFFTCLEENRNLTRYKNLYFGCKTQRDSLTIFEELFYSCQEGSREFKNSIRSRLEELQTIEDEGTRKERITSIINELKGDGSD